MLLAILALLLLGVLWLLAIHGRRNHPGLKALYGWSYAHRGLHSEGVPENSMAAFRAALANGYGAELDVHLLSDSGLAVIHDSKLLRTAGVAGNVENLTTEDLKHCFLEGTEETVPTLNQVLTLFSGKAPLIIELKVYHNNYAALCQRVCDLLESYPGSFCLESFDPRAVRWLKTHRPELLRGQLAENFFANPEVRIPFLLKVLLSFNLANFWTKPDFISYRFAHRHCTLSNRLLRKRMPYVGWTIRTPEDHATAISENWIPIFEGFRP